MSRIQKFLERLFRQPPPNDIHYKEMARFLLSIGCKMRKKGGSHRQFKYPEYQEIITLMENESVRPYQIEDTIRLLKYLGIYKEEE